MKKVAVVGGGIIGTSWALVFARTSVVDSLIVGQPSLENAVRELWHGGLGGNLCAQHGIDEAH